MVTKNGVSEGIRTLDHRSHNPALYQLSYTHHYFHFYFGMISLSRHPLTWAAKKYLIYNSATTSSDSQHQIGFIFFLMFFTSFRTFGVRSSSKLTAAGLIEERA